MKIEFEINTALERNKKTMGNLRTPLENATERQYMENAMAITFVY